jgi:hypothetical protein
VLGVCRHGRGFETGGMLASPPDAFEPRRLTPLRFRRIFLTNPSSKAHHWPG